MVRTGGWKYVYDPEDPVDQLFDLARDPWEFENLAGDPGHAETVARMRRLLLDWHVGRDRLPRFRLGAPR
jgi:choline-sulfatase